MLDSNGKFKHILDSTNNVLFLPKQLCLYFLSDIN